MKIFGRCFQLVCTVYKRLHTQKISNSPSNFFFIYVKILYFTLYYYIYMLLLYYYTTILKPIKIKIILLLILWSCKATGNIAGSCITRQDRNKMHSDRYASHEFLQVLHAKECLSESLCLRCSLCLHLRQ